MSHLCCVPRNVTRFTRKCSAGPPRGRAKLQHIRGFGSTSNCFREHEPRGAVSFSEFADDVMSAPLSRIQPLTETALVTPNAGSAPKSEREEVMAKARIVFGSRLAGPGERQKAIDQASTIIAGIAVPPKPEEPDNCCMSGCVNCVWDQFRDELEEWAAKSAEARARLKQRRNDSDSVQKSIMTSAGTSHIAASMDDEGGGSESLWTSSGMHQEGADLFADIPVGIREFMKTEKKLKDRHRNAQTRSQPLPG